MTIEELKEKLKKDIAEQKQLIDLERGRLIRCVEAGNVASLETYSTFTTELYMLEYFQKLLENIK